MLDRRQKSVIGVRLSLSEAVAALIVLCLSEDFSNQTGRGTDEGGATQLLPASPFARARDWPLCCSSLVRQVSIREYGGTRPCAIPLTFERRPRWLCTPYSAKPQAESSQVACVSWEDRLITDEAEIRANSAKFQESMPLHDRTRGDNAGLVELLRGCLEISGHTGLLLIRSMIIRRCHPQPPSRAAIGRTPPAIKETLSDEGLSEGPIGVGTWM
jgi:hypothetical protein